MRLGNVFTSALSASSGPFTLSRFESIVLGPRHTHISVRARMKHLIEVLLYTGREKYAKNNVLRFQKVLV